VPAFQYRLILKDGTPADPQFVTATPTWKRGRHVHVPSLPDVSILAIN
jgi:hypothetical protein